MADDIAAQVRAVPGLPEVIADLLGDGLGFSCLGDNDKAFEWALRAYRAGQAAPFGSEVVALAVRRLVDNSYLGEDDLDRDDLEEIARIVLTAATLDRPGRPAAPDGPRTWALPDEPGPEVTALRDRLGHIWDRDDGGWRYRVSGLIPGVHGTWRRWDGLLVTEGPLTDATPAETGRAPATIDAAGRTGAGAGTGDPDRAETRSGGRDG